MQRLAVTMLFGCPCSRQHLKMRPQPRGGYRHAQPSIIVLYLFLGGIAVKSKKLPIVHTWDTLAPSIEPLTPSWCAVAHHCSLSERDALEYVMCATKTV